ncbi:MAG: hypothetical protein V2J13_10325 [Cycloclasticus sp.]|jgi:hypothetical protein|nr:hypothetical protein [Cycloclasticus sp.]
MPAVHAVLSKNNVFAAARASISFYEKKWIKENVAHIAKFNLFRVNTKLGAFYPKGISLTQMTKLFGSALKQRAYSSETIQTFNAIKGA